mmetsp:Transcript_22899/g.63283  ORF Transcript_22899/g.63283 Transcript_22899/m.63283 type:complete len:234 (-) Transcript_22899:1163-1864(-)
MGSRPACWLPALLFSILYIWLPLVDSTRLDLGGFMACELRRHSSLAINEQPVEVVENFLVTHSKESYGNTLLSSTTSSANTVGVGLNTVGHVVVDNQRNIWHIDTTARNIGGNEDVEGVVAETFDADLTLILLLATMQHRAPVAKGLQLGIHVVALALGVDKNNGALLVHKVQLLLQPCRLLVFLDHLHPLCDGIRGTTGCANVDHHWPAQVLARQTLNRWWHSGGKHVCGAI